MKFFDRINLIGRLLVGIYFIGTGSLNWLFTHDNLAGYEYGLVVFNCFWMTLGGLFLLLGIKPRATAAALIVILGIQICVDIYVFEKQALDFLKELFTYFGIFGALLFIAGTRMIPYGLMIRSEDSMQQKYGTRINK